MCGETVRDSSVYTTTRQFWKLKFYSKAGFSNVTICKVVPAEAENISSVFVVSFERSLPVTLDRKL